MPLNTATETLEFVENLFKTSERPLPRVADKECEIEGEKRSFDYSAKCDLNSAIKFYDNADYIGSGHKAWFDGVLNVSDETVHFFVKRI